MLNIIGGLDRPTKGSVKVAGQDTAKLSESQFAALRHDTVGFIFQSYNLIPFLSAVENVELPLMFEPYDRKALRRRATELLEIVGLGHRVHHQPTKMSGGEQQRTAIARSLISNPTLVLADEPTANLDHRTGETVVRMLRDLCSTLGVTVVASTHDPTVADEASRVVRMKDGQIVNYRMTCRTRGADRQSDRDKLMTTELVPEQILPKVMTTFGLTAAYVFIICWITGSSVMAGGGWTAIPMWVLGILDLPGACGHGGRRTGQSVAGPGWCVHLGHPHDGGDVGLHRRLPVLGAGDPQRRLLAGDRAAVAAAGLSHRDSGSRRASSCSWSSCGP